MPGDFELRTDPNITTHDSNAVTPKQAEKLHDWPTPAKNKSDPIVVAVMDTGIHPELVKNHPWFEHVEVTKRHDATGDGTGKDKVGHGSAVASIYGRNAANLLAKSTGQDTPIKLYSVRIFGKKGHTTTPVIKKAYKWLIQHGDEIDIVNMSWGAQRDVAEIDNLHEKLLNKGVNDVVAAGNTGNSGGSPATAKKAFSAGAVDINGDLTRFSSYNPQQGNPDVDAIGKNVKLARAPGTSMGHSLNDQFTKASGTSFSAPYTGAGYALALYQHRQSYDSAFEKAAKTIPGVKQKEGHGLLKVKPALQGGAGGHSHPSTDGDVYLFFGEEFVAIDADWLPTGSTKVEKVDETKNDVTLRFSK